MSDKTKGKEPKSLIEELEMLGEVSLTHIRTHTQRARAHIHTYGPGRVVCLGR